MKSGITTLSLLDNMGLVIGLILILIIVGLIALVFMTCDLSR